MIAGLVLRARANRANGWLTPSLILKSIVRLVRARRLANRPNRKPEYDHGRPQCSGRRGDTT